MAEEDILSQLDKELEELGELVEEEKETSKESKKKSAGEKKDEGKTSESISLEEIEELKETRKETSSKPDSIAVEEKEEKKEDLSELGLEPVVKEEEPGEAKEELPGLGAVEEEKTKKIFEEIEVVEEETPPSKMVVVIYGDKGTGKTTTAMSFPGEVAVLSFDRKATPIKHYIFNNEPRIHVFDAIKYMVWDPKKATESAEKTFHYILKILDHVEEKIKPDWIVIDGTEILENILELAMRYRHGLEPFQGVRNLNVWKERKYMLREIHNRALSIAKRGVIYTTYTQYEDVVVDGELVTRKEVPKWIDIIMMESDIVLKTELNPRDRVFRVKVVTSKFDKILPTGKYFDVTDNPLGNQVKWG